MSELVHAWVWDGSPSSFADFYEWAGAQRHNVREIPAVADDDEYIVEVYRDAKGWQRLAEGQSVMKAGDGLLVVPKATNPEPVQTPAGPETDKETKDSPETGGVETKPALPAQTAAPAKATAPAAKATAPAAPAAK